jgi:hypothetical protein
VVDLVVTVSVEDVVAELGLKVPVAPVGKPATERATGPLKPLSGLTVTV